MTPRLKRALLLCGGLVVVVSVLLEAVVPDAHHADPAWTLHWYNRLPGWNALLGFAGCVAIIVLSKALGAVWLQKPPDYYDE